MTTALQWSRAQALSISASPGERGAVVLPALLLLLVLLRSITGS